MGSPNATIPLHRVDSYIYLIISSQFMISVLLITVEVGALRDPDPHGGANFFAGAVWIFFTRVSWYVEAACGAMWCWWAVRGIRNLQASRVSPLRHTPAWAVAWWFIPGINLVMPYLATIELWKQSAAAAERHGAPHDKGGLPFWLHVWWGAWVLHLLANLAFRFYPFEHWMGAATVSVVRDVAVFVSAPLAIMLVAKVTRNQMFIDNRFLASEAPSS
jgi:hypothetical protein